MEETRKPRRKRRFKRRKKAFQITPAAEKCYEETLLELKRSVNLEESCTKVHRIRKTQNGSVLFELEAIEDQQKLENAVKSVTDPESNFRDLIHTLKLEIRDLDGVRKEQ